MNLKTRMDKLEKAANEIFGFTKSDILIQIGPGVGGKEWDVYICANWKTGQDYPDLREKLLSCETWEELEKMTEGYASNMPKRVM